MGIVVQITCVQKVNSKSFNDMFHIRLQQSMSVYVNLTCIIDKIALLLLTKYETYLVYVKFILYGADDLLAKNLGSVQLCKHHLDLSEQTEEELSGRIFLITRSIPIISICPKHDEEFSKIF